MSFEREREKEHMFIRVCVHMCVGKSSSSPSLSICMTFCLYFSFFSFFSLSLCASFVFLSHSYSSICWKVVLVEVATATVPTIQIVHMIIAACRRHRFAYCRRLVLRTTTTELLFILARRCCCRRCVSRRLSPVFGILVHIYYKNKKRERKQTHAKIHSMVWWSLLSF